MRWVFIAVCRFSLVAVSRGYSSLLCTGLSLRWLLLLQSTGCRHEGFSSCSVWALGCTGFSSCGSQALEPRLRGCGTWAQLPRHMWDLPGPGIEPESPALAGRFSKTVPPGKSLYLIFDSLINMCLGMFLLGFILLGLSVLPGLD